VGGRSARACDASAATTKRAAACEARGRLRLLDATIACVDRVGLDGQMPHVGERFDQLHA
jgi:hypothetical protein